MTSNARDAWEAKGKELILPERLEVDRTARCRSLSSSSPSSPVSFGSAAAAAAAAAAARNFTTLRQAGDQEEKGNGFASFL